ncbi:MAG: hypothetical protein JEZ14_25225 [Marinilabiliaceae bacterium]|nr:hypothetical protein [Marinilabiliaceae bacterium]MBI9065311.1 hypothetical protein [Marinilabiliaceae bacterium]
MAILPGINGYLLKFMGLAPWSEWVSTPINGHLFREVRGATQIDELISREV